MRSLEDFVRLLSKRTEDGDIRWRQDNLGVYSAEIRDATIIISLFDGSENLTDICFGFKNLIRFGIYDDKTGSEVKNIALTSSDESFDIFLELFEKAKASARSSNQYVEELFGELERLGK
jgi:hypothetical protein